MFELTLSGPRLFALLRASQALTVLEASTDLQLEGAGGLGPEVLRRHISLLRDDLDLALFGRAPATEADRYQLDAILDSEQELNR